MNKLVLLSFILIGTLAGCSWFGSDTKTKVAQLKVVNVLELEQYQDCHIKGSIHVPFDKLEQFANGLNPDTELVFYCSNYRCTASGYAAKMFAKLGFKHALAYEAGVAEWFQTGLPVEGPCRASYLQIKMDPIPAETGVSVISTSELKAKLGY